jgi:hypothetical protein
MANTRLRFTLVVLASTVGLVGLTACQSNTVPNAASVTSKTAKSARPDQGSVLPYIWIGDKKKDVEGYGNGDIAAPQFNIHGNLTQLATVYAIVADEQNGDIYVGNAEPGSNPPLIVVFSNTANGNSPPIATLSSSALYSGGISLALDPLQNIWVGQTFSIEHIGGLVEFAAGAQGPSAAPIAQISGKKTTLANVDGVATDESGNVYAMGDSIYPAQAEIAEFSARSNGNVPPIRIIQGNHTGFQADASNFGIAVDNDANIYIADYSNKSVKIFTPDQSGNVYPHVVIQGSNTGFVGPIAVAVDEARDIYVADQDANEIFVFAAGAQGNATPIRIISDGVNSPEAVTLCEQVPPCEGSVTPPLATHAGPRS